MGQAETIWVKWRRGRVDWLAQIAYRTELTQRLEDFNVDAPYMQAVQRGVEDAAREAPDLDSPDQFRERLNVLAQEINRYARLQAQMLELNQLRNQLPANETQPWRLKAQSLERRLDALLPSDLSSHTDLQTEIECAVAELTQLVSQRSEPDATVRGVTDIGTSVLHLVSPAPSALPASVEEVMLDARSRLWLFTRATYVIAVVLLAGVGFGELYVSRPAFGANAWGDYFALVAWGFGAEASRAAIAEMMRGWGLPAFRWP
jgi:hypothetical protein